MKFDQVLGLDDVFDQVLDWMKVDQDLGLDEV